MMDKRVVILAPGHAQTHGSSSNSYGMPYHNYSHQSYPFPTCSTNIEPNFVPNEPNNFNSSTQRNHSMFSNDVHNALPTLRGLIFPKIYFRED